MSAPQGTMTPRVAACRYAAVASNHESTDADRERAWMDLENAARAHVDAEARNRLDGMDRARNRACGLQWVP